MCKTSDCRVLICGHAHKAKLIRKLRLLASSCLSIRPHGTRLTLERFSWNLIFLLFRKSVEKIQV
jgi:hypothetical protein